MKGKIIKIFIFLTMGTAMPFGCFAETLSLKSGKTVEGDLVERTDRYIKIDLSGVALTYYIEDIEEIDGKPIALYLSEKKAETKKVQKALSSIASQSTVHWGDWYAGVGDYMSKMQSISIKGNSIFRTLRTQLEEASIRKDFNKIDEISANTKQEITSLLKELDSLKPPEELVVYHGKQVALLADIDEYVASLPKKKGEIADVTTRKITLTMQEACVELKQVYLKHEAPKEFIEALDAVISQLSSTLEKMSPQK